MSKEGRTTNAWITFGLFAAFLLFIAAVIVPINKSKKGREEVVTATADINLLRKQIISHFREKGTLPAGMAELEPLPKPLSGDKRYTIAFADGAISVNYGESYKSIGGKTAIITPVAIEGLLRWDCSKGTLPEDFRLSWTYCSR